MSGKIPSEFGWPHPKPTYFFWGGTIVASLEVGVYILKVILFLLFLTGLTVHCSTLSCPQFYVGPSKSTFLRVADILQSSSAEIQRAQSQFGAYEENFFNRDELSLQDYQADIKEVLRNRPGLTLDRARAVVDEILSSNFLFSHFHKSMVVTMQGLNYKSKVEWQKVIEGVLDDSKEGRAKTGTRAKMIAVSIKNSINNYNERYQQDPKHFNILAQFKDRFRYERRDSDSKITALFKQLVTTLNDPNEFEVFTLMLERSLLSVLKSEYKIRFGAANTFTGHLGSLVIAPLPLFGYFGASALFPDFFQYLGDGTKMGSVFALAYTMVQTKRYFLDMETQKESSSHISRDVTRFGYDVNRIATKPFRWWTERKEKKQIVAHTINTLELGQNWQDHSIPIEELVIQARTDLTKDFSDPTEITLWSDSIARAIEGLIHGENAISNKLNILKGQKDATNLQTALSDLSADYALLGQDILLTSMVLDLYKIKAKKFDQPEFVPSSYVDFFKHKKELLEAESAQMENLARVLAIRLDVLNREMSSLESLLSVGNSP